MAKPARPLSLDPLFRALADPTRLRLLSLIADREICVCYFVGILGIPQPKVSRHLAYLRRAGLVLARREGKWMHYRLALPIDKKTDNAAAAILREIVARLRTRPQMQRDISRLRSACCAPAKFAVRAGAPQPSRVQTAHRI